MKEQPCFLFKAQDFSAHVLYCFMVLNLKKKYIKVPSVLANNIHILCTSRLGENTDKSGKIQNGNLHDTYSNVCFQKF